MEQEQAIPTVYFYIPEQVTILDLSGVLQVFEEAKFLGFNYHFEFISSQSKVNCSSGLELSALNDFKETSPTKNDIIFISGASTHQMIHCSEDQSFFDWLKRAHTNETTICSICSGAFLLAKSGLLNHKECTTHWGFIKKMKTEFPLLKIQDNTLFTKSDNIYTSAGVVTGIDLALFLIEERHGKQIATEVAKGLVVYKRRHATDEQESVYLQNRSHQDEKIHIVQDWIIHNLEDASTIENLAELVHVSPRNLTRTFKKRTGVTIAEYRTKLRIEKAKSLLSNSDYKIEHIANLCGYRTSKQLRMVLEKHHESLPSEFKNKLS
ncbi:GlxA family transcriptional regulator [Marinifilum sp. D737]|uniref:GlxA family transcriptional regulator n=1 Tax=Marinifilum sp. D737 TaxID=2969628 RepID=UPI00227703AB|nr:DJ-1/PfpI family protein [Marinifilum sp. D737]MCY1635432.1 DJ-1/PfpI family protein [Marinifilum sp. D737]